MISPYKIRWNGYSSLTIGQFDLITCLSFDGDSGATETFLSREAVASETYNGALKRASSYKWSESMSPSITIVKKDYSDFTRAENRQILSWLTSKQTPGFLDIYINEDYTNNDTDIIAYSILGNFVSVQQYKLGNSRIVGYVAQFESLMPWALSGLQTMEIDGANLATYEKKDATTLETIQVPMYTQYIDIDTDEPESAIYPRITITQKDSVIVPVDHKMINNNAWIVGEEWMDGTVYYYETDKMYYYQKHFETIDDNGNTIWKSEPTATQNNPVTENTKTSVIIQNEYKISDVPEKVVLRIANNTGGETVVLDGANQVVSSSSKSRIFGDDFIGWNWLPLYNGKNKITVIGNCTVTFEWREPRKVGEF